MSFVKKSLKYGLKTFELASIWENILWIKLNIVTLCQCLVSRSVGSTRFCFLDPLKFADPQIRIQGENINLKLLKKKLVLLQTPNLNYWKKEIKKMSRFLNVSWSFSIKISKKILVILKKCPGSGSASKLN